MQHLSLFVWQFNIFFFGHELMENFFHCWIIFAYFLNIIACIQHHHHYRAYLRFCVVSRPLLDIVISLCLKPMLPNPSQVVRPYCVKYISAMFIMFQAPFPIFFCLSFFILALCLKYLPFRCKMYYRISFTIFLGQASFDLSIRLLVVPFNLNRGFARQIKADNIH